MPCSRFKDAARTAQSELSDRVVVFQYLAAFVAEASLITDWAAVADANATFFYQCAVPCQGRVQGHTLENRLL